MFLDLGVFVNFLKLHLHFCLPVHFSNLVKKVCLQVGRSHLNHAFQYSVVVARAQCCGGTEGGGAWLRRECNRAYFLEEEMSSKLERTGISPRENSPWSTRGSEQKQGGRSLHSTWGDCDQWASTVHKS